MTGLLRCWFTKCGTSQIADQPPSKKNTDSPALQVWTLKTQHRAEVRPRLTTGEVERSRNTTPTHTEGRASPMPVPEAKKPAMPRKELKTKKKADVAILAKNESSGSSNSSIPLREAVGASTKATPSPLPPPMRRLPPGSGFRAKASSPSLPSPPTPTIPQKRAHPTETAERREPSRLASSSRPSPSAAQLPHKPSPTPSTTRQLVDPQKARGDDAPPKRKRLEEDLQAETPHVARIPKKRKLDDGPQASPRESREQSTTYEDGELPEPPVVRKKPKLDDSRPRDGHRDRERERERPRERDRDREREPKALPPKPVRTREPSPRKSQQVSTPLVHQNRDAHLDKPTTTVRATSKPHNGKFKRGSSIYTSSDDETPLKEQAPQPKTSANIPPQHKKKRDPLPRPPLPSDPAGIRAAYRERYVPYITTYGKVVAQRAKLEEALSGSVTSDTDLMDEDEVTKLSNELKTYQRELETIEAAYKKAGGRGKLEPQRMGKSSSSD